MADDKMDADAYARAEHRKKLATFSTAHRELIGKAIIDGLINTDLVSSSGGGGNYIQDGGPYSQSGGGNHWQGGGGGYTQSKLESRGDWAINPAEILNKLVEERLKVIEQLRQLQPRG